MTAEPIIFYLAAALVIASLNDIKAFRIPNWLTYSTIGVGISYFTIVKGYEGFLFSLGGAAAGFSLLALPYVIGGTGAGDVKLLGGVGCFLGPHAVLRVFFLSCILGFVYAVLILASKGLLVGTFKRYGIMLRTFTITRHFFYIPPSDSEKQIKIKFGLAIALGTGLYLFFI